MKILVLSLFFVSFEISAEVFQIGGTGHLFEVKKSVLVSGCEKSCEALDTIAKFKKIDLTKARKNLSFVGSTGSDVCKLVYKTKAIIGVNEAKDQRAFCVFKDQSMIEINSLSNYLESQKIIK